MGKWTRRGFIGAGIVTGGALVIGVAIRPGHRAPGLAKYVAGEDESLVNAWVKIDRNNKVTAIVPHSEMGQGAQTALTQMLADELDARWEDVSFLEAPAEDEYANYPLGKGFVLGSTPIPKMLSGTVDGVFLAVTKSLHLQITGGSSSIRATGVYGMRVAGAAAKIMLREAAAEKWGVNPEEVVAQEGMLIHSASSNKATYADFASQAAEKTPPVAPTLKTPDQFTIMGKHKPRFDIPAKVDGTAMFGIDVVVDGMKYASVKAAPVFGATLKSADTAAAEKMPGVIKVVKLADAVAVVADGYWLADKALAMVDVKWNTTKQDGNSSAKIFDQFESDMASSRESGDVHGDMQIGDADKSLEAADRIIERKYKVPYLAHCLHGANECGRTL